MNKILAPRLERDGSHTVYDARRSGLSSLTTSPLGSPLPHEGTLMPGGYGTGPPQPSKETNQAKDLPSPTSTITGSLLSPEGSKIISSQTWSPSETQPLPPTPESGVLPRKTGSGHNAGTSISGSPGSSTYGPPPDDLISPGIRRSPDPFVIPTITPGEQIRDTLTGSTRIYRDERHNFRILLHPGWVEDNLIVGREERSGNRLTCGFSHLIHSSPGESEPDCIILIKIEESRPGAAEPLRELILWLERDKKIGQRLDLVESPRVIKNDLALAKVIFSVSEGSDFPQLRVVQEGNSGFVAYIKAQSLVKIEPHKDAAQRIMREDAESVVKSFEFISP